MTETPTTRTMADYLTAHEQLFDTYATWSAGFGWADLEREIAMTRNPARNRHFRRKQPVAAISSRPWFLVAKSIVS